MSAVNKVPAISGVASGIRLLRCRRCKDSTRSEATKCLSDSEGNLGQSE